MEDRSSRRMRTLVTLLAQRGLSANEVARALISMVARSTTRSNQRPDTLMQDRSPPPRRKPLATHGRTIHWVKPGCRGASATRPLSCRKRSSFRRRDRSQMCQNLTHAPQQTTCAGLFDHLVGACEQRRRNVQTERLGGFKIDDEFELGRLQNRQLGWLRAFENPACVNARLPGGIGKAGS